MDNSKQFLIEIVDEQKKTIEKYTNKLRDVVAAHKSLLVEKKALEDTLKILNEAKSLELSKTKQTDDIPDGVSKIKITAETSQNAAELKSQLNSLLELFSKLVAEKSHMEECFKTNQKQLLEGKEAVEHKCKELQEEVKNLNRQLKHIENKNFSENFNTKRTFKNENLHIKSNQENDSLVIQVKNYEREVKSLKSELEAKALIQEISDKKLKESYSEVTKLQEVIKNLQLEHEKAMQNEKEKTKDLEEHAKKLTAIQEERVVNLETRLAELSETIGSYDRLRLQDQIEIQKLKEHIAFIDTSHKIVNDTQRLDITNLDEFNTILGKILELKKQLLFVAQKCGKEEDYKNLFCEKPSNDDIHLLCKEEYNQLKSEFDFFKNEVKTFCNNQPKSGKDIVVLQNQIKNLQEKGKIISDKNKEMEKEYQIQIDQLKKNIKNEKTKFKESLNALESDHKARVWLLEEQLQKQRERSLVLLEEKEKEIHALQSTFQMFLPGYGVKSNDETSSDPNVLTKNQLIDGPHIVHYANELARRDVEISNLRKNKHQTEMSLRDLQKEVASVLEKHKEEKQSLQNKIARLERCQTREGANMEYLKNVVYSFLLSSDPKSKRHMCNAIAAVLKFSDSELQKVIAHSKNSWWTSATIL